MDQPTRYPEKNLKQIGTRPVRPDGVPKVTGRAQYGADWNLPGMLWGKVLRSPHAHARVAALDITAATAMAGVVAVYTEADLTDVQPIPGGLGFTREAQKGQLLDKRIPCAECGATGKAIVSVETKFVP